MDGRFADGFTNSLARSLSRRTALRRLGSGGLVAAAGFASIPGLVAAQSTPEASTGAVPPLIQSWFDAWNAHDITKLVALYTDDGSYEDVPSEQIATGTGNITAFLTGFLQTSSDIALELHNGFIGGEWGAAEWIFSGTNQGFIPGGVGKSFSVRAATIFQLSGDKIARSSDYYDQYKILIQLGLIPSPGTPTAGTPAA